MNENQFKLLELINLEKLSHEELTSIQNKVEKELKDRNTLEEFQDVYNAGYDTGFKEGYLQTRQLLHELREMQISLHDDIHDKVIRFNDKQHLVQHSMQIIVKLNNTLNTGDNNVVEEETREH